MSVARNGTGLVINRPGLSDLANGVKLTDSPPSITWRAGARLGLRLRPRCLLGASPSCCRAARRQSARSAEPTARHLGRQSAACQELPNP